MSQTRDKLKAPSAAAFAAVAASKQLRAVAVAVAVALPVAANWPCQPLATPSSVTTTGAESRAEPAAHIKASPGLATAAAAAASSDCGNMLEITFLCKLWQKENSKR